MITGNTFWKYDERGRVISQTNTIGAAYTTQLTYNAHDLVVTMVYPGATSETVTTAYDAWGRPSTLSGSGDR